MAPALRTAPPIPGMLMKAEWNRPYTGSSTPRFRHHAVISTGMSGAVVPPEWLPTIRNGPLSGRRSMPRTSGLKYDAHVSSRPCLSRMNSGSRPVPAGSGSSTTTRLRAFGSWRPSEGVSTTRRSVAAVDDIAISSGFGAERTRRLAGHLGPGVGTGHLDPGGVEQDDTQGNGEEQGGHGGR